MAVGLFALVFASCGGNDPKSAFEKAIKAEAALDYKAMAEQVDLPEGVKAEDYAKQLEQLAELGKAMGAKVEKKEVEKIEYKDDAVKEEGEKVTVKAQVTYKGEKEAVEETKTFKKVNGDLKIEYVDLSKKLK